MFLNLAIMVRYMGGACAVIYSTYCGYRLGEQYGQIGVEYIVGGVLLGRGILPHVRQSNWRNA